MQTSGAVKLYLFDVFTKLAIAADSAPDDSLQFHVCSDVIDIAVDVGTICWSVTNRFVSVVKIFQRFAVIVIWTTVIRLFLRASNFRE